MGTINVKRFLGTAPKISAKLLNEAQAQTARNAKLWSEELRSFAGLGSATALDKTTGDIQTIYRFKGDTVWLEWTQDVNVVRGPIANDALEKTYFTGTDTPRVTTNDIYNLGTTGTNRPPDSYILGIPAPVGPPVATDSAAGNITATSTWVYTFVRKYSDGTVEESAPSVPSNSLVSAARQVSVTLPNGAITHANYGITHKRLYRSDGGLYKFVSEVTLATSPTIDNLATASLGSAIATTLYLPPPDGMVGLIMLPNGITAGFKDNVVYLSEPYRPHTYPLANQYSVNFPIVGLGNVGTSVIVLTQGNPFVGRGVDPAAYAFKRHPGMFPCVSKRSIASSDLGVLWASTGGIAISDGVSVTLATRDFLTQEEWQRDYYPTTLHAAVKDQRYFAWFTTGTDSAGTKVGGGLILDRAERAFFSTLGDYVYASHAIPTSGDLWVANRNPYAGLRNYVYKWEADPANPIAYEWKSKVFVQPGRDNFAFAQIIADYSQGLSPSQIAAIQAQIAIVQAANSALVSTDGPINGNSDGFEIDGGALGGDNLTQLAPSLTGQQGIVTFRYWVNSVLVLTRAVSSDDPFPLPAGMAGELHEFQVSGTVPVAQVSLATSMEELATV